MNIHLAPNKAFLNYPSVYLLGQYIDTLGLATAEDKLTTIRNLEFPKILAALERYLGMTGYLKQYIPYYLAIIKPLQERKTILNRNCGNRTNNARKSKANKSYLQIPTLQELNAYHQLQEIFASPTILHHHDPTRQLYVDLDASKEFGFGAHIYHSKKDAKITPTNFAKAKSAQITITPKTNSAVITIAVTEQSQKPSSDEKPSLDKKPSTISEALKQRSMQPILFLSR